MDYRSHKTSHFRLLVQACGTEMRGYDIATNTAGLVAEAWQYWMVSAAGVLLITLFALVKNRSFGSKVGLGVGGQIREKSCLSLNSFLASTSNRPSNVMLEIIGGTFRKLTTVMPSWNLRWTLVTSRFLTLCVMNLLLNSPFPASSSLMTKMKSPIISPPFSSGRIRKRKSASDALRTLLSLIDSNYFARVVRSLVSECDDFEGTLLQLLSG